MLFAKIANGTIARPRPGLAGTCPGCDQELVPKCGTQVIWHWAHGPSDLVACDEWSEGETDWHLGWKEQALEFGCRVEVVMRDKNYWHRADIVRSDGVSVEIQHSPIGEGEALERESFYRRAGGMIWLFDARERWWSQVQPYGADSTYDGFRDATWDHYSQTVAALNAPMYWDTPFGLQSVMIEPGWRGAPFVSLHFKQVETAEVFDPALSPVQTTAAAAVLVPASEAWRALGERCWSCGAKPISKYGDGSPRYTCYIADPAGHTPRLVTDSRITVAA